MRFRDEWRPATDARQRPIQANRTHTASQRAVCLTGASRYHWSMYINVP